MESYNVKQIAEMLNTRPETVRRWIRSGKLKAQKASRKEGHVVSGADLKEFLKRAPKYAGVAESVIGKADATSLHSNFIEVGEETPIWQILKNAGTTEEISFSQDDILKLVRKEKERRMLLVQQKQRTIEQLQREIINDQQQITECNYILSKFSEEEQVFIHKNTVHLDNVFIEDDS